VNNEDLIHIAIDAMPASESGWVETLSALLVPTIAVLGLYIAYQQYRLNKQRLRHETYERRLTVYRSVQRYLSEILADGKTTNERALKFYSETSEAAFLFDDSVQNKIDRIYTKSQPWLQHEKRCTPPMARMDYLLAQNVAEFRLSTRIYFSGILVNSKNLARSLPIS